MYLQIRKCLLDRNGELVEFEFVGGLGVRHRKVALQENLFLAANHAIDQNFDFESLK